MDKLSEKINVGMNIVGVTHHVIKVERAQTTPQNLIHQRGTIPPRGMAPQELRRMTCRHQQFDFS
jgi:hypothetical protein